MDCPYCKKEAEWVENKKIYGKNYGRSFMVYFCRACDAYVGCHNNTRKPLGTMADRDTREWRKKAHAAFDPLWKIINPTRRPYKLKRLLQSARQKAYNRLKNHFGEEIHIGESNVERCKKIISVCEKLT